MWICVHDDVCHEVKQDLIQEKSEFYFLSVFMWIYLCTMMSLMKLNKIYSRKKWILFFIDFHVN